MSEQEITPTGTSQPEEDPEERGVRWGMEAIRIAEHFTLEERMNILATWDILAESYAHAGRDIDALDDFDEDDTPEIIFARQQWIDATHKAQERVRATLGLPSGKVTLR